MRAERPDASTGKMARLFRVRIEAGERAIASALLFEAGFGGIVEEPEVLNSEGLQTRALSSRVVLCVGMDDVQACAAAETRFGELCRNAELAVETWHELLSDDWRTGWIEHLEPVRLCERLTLVPHAPGGTREPDTIYLEPALAFGFGEHATTRLAAEWLLECVAAKRVLDVGTGTGVLALVAAWAGARHVTGVDIDPASVRAAEVNATLNDLHRVCEFSLAQLGELPRDFDVVIANIDALTLAALSEQMCARLSAGGKLALTGVLVEQAEEVTHAFRHQGLALHVHAEADGWALLST